MKKAFRCARQIYCAALFATLLFFPCACIKQSVQEVHVQADITTNNSAQGQQASEVSGMQPDDDASKKTDAPLSFRAQSIRTAKWGRIKREFAVLGIQAIWACRSILLCHRAGYRCLGR